MFVRVHLHDEAPEIGSGVRLLFVESVGPKTVKVRCPWTFTPHSFKASVWNEIPQTEVTIRKGLITRAAKRTAEARRRSAHDKAQAEWLRKNPFSQDRPPAFEWKGGHTLKRQADRMLGAAV